MKAIVIKEHGKVVYCEQVAEKNKARQIASLKSELAKYDYIGIKIAMGVATKEDYATEIAHTEELRQEIRKLCI